MRNVRSLATEAAHALLHSQDQLKEAEKLNEEAREIAKEARELRRRNHFAEALERDGHGR